MTCEEFKTLAPRFSGPMLMSERIALARHIHTCAACSGYAKARAAEQTAKATPAAILACHLRSFVLAQQAKAEQGIDEELRLP